MATGSKWEPFRLLDPVECTVDPAAAFFADLLAAGRSEATIRSYGMDLLRWFRFLWAIGVGWDRATRIEARDFSRWLTVTGHRGRPYSPAVRAHSETVLRTFYDFHRDVGSGPMLNPFPLDRSRRGGRAHAHHNPMEPHRAEKTGLYRPRPQRRIPRSIPTRCSTRSSLDCHRTGTDRWSPSTCPPAHEPRSCCRPAPTSGAPAPNWARRRFDRVPPDRTPGCTAPETKINKIQRTHRDRQGALQHAVRVHRGAGRRPRGLPAGQAVPPRAAAAPGRAASR